MFKLPLARLLIASLLTTVALIGWQSALASLGDEPIEHRLTSAQMHETGLDTLSAAQLARLNAVLHDQSAAGAHAAMPATGADRGVASYIGMDVRPITTRAKGEVRGWQPGTVFELENGQTWKVLKGSMVLPKPMQSPTVVLVPGIAGRWFLQVDEDLPKARVYRID